MSFSGFFRSLIEKQPFFNNKSLYFELFSSLSMVNIMKTSNRNGKTTTKKKQQNKDKNLKLLVEDCLKFGDLLLIANKGCGKTNALMVLSQAFRDLENTKVIIFEDFPKFCLEFNEIAYFVIKDSDVIETSHSVDLEDYFLRHERDYSVKRGAEIKEFLDNNKDVVFTMEISDIDYYRKHYLRKYKEYNKSERIVFIIEESQNVFDSSTISKKIFNRLRKIFSVARNLDLHFVLASQRLQDLNTKIRGRTRLLIGQVSIDDWELKIRRLLRNSKYKTEILNFERGKFLYTAKDNLIKFPKFEQEGKPKQWRKPRAKTQKKKKTLAQRVLSVLTFGATYYKDHKEDFEKIEYPEEPEYEDSSDSDLIEFGL
jgi:hypothetical protein